MIMLSIITLFFIVKIEALHVHASDDLTAKVDELFKEWDRNDSPGAALGIIRDGKMIYKRGYGMADLEHNIPIKPDSVFRIASISKQFFAAGIIILEQQGKISLDDDIRKYLPELVDYGHTVTIRHLIHHTGGIRDYLSLNRLTGRRIGKRASDYFSMEDHMELMVRQKDLNFIPGEKFVYSNSGYVLLAEIIARVSGSSEADFLKKYIFDPLGMKNTLVHTDCDQIVKNRAVGYSPTPDGRYEIDITRDQTTGHDAVFTTVEDMFLWDQNFYNNKLGIDKEQFIKAQLRRGKLNNGEKITYAAGLGFAEYKGLRTVGHGGAWVGYKAIYERWPNQRFSIILFSNLGTFKAGTMARKIADIYLADKFAKKEEKKLASIEEKQLLACEAFQNRPDRTSPNFCNRIHHAGFI
jgi:CubicO group peptidase (beta-lactamase class C family)